MSRRLNGVLGHDELRDARQHEWKAQMESLGLKRAPRDVGIQGGCDELGDGHREWRRPESTTAQV